MPAIDRYKKRNTNANYRYPKRIIRDQPGQVNHTPVIDRYATSDKKQPSQPIPNPGMVRVVVNRNWFRWSPTYNQVMRAEIRSITGSRFTISGPPKGSSRIVVVQNPMARVQEQVGKGFETIVREAQLGSFKAQMNELNNTRRRR